MAIPQYKYNLDHLDEQILAKIEHLLPMLMLGQVSVGDVNNDYVLKVDKLEMVSEGKNKY